MKNKVTVSKVALLRRVNRWLKKKQQKMIKVHRPGGRATAREAELGTYFIVRASSIVARKVDIEAFAREHSVLESYEEVAP